jgi:hypothetical protein
MATLAASTRRITPARQAGSARPIAPAGQAGEAGPAARLVSAAVTRLRERRSPIWVAALGMVLAAALGFGLAQILAGTAKSGTTASSGPAHPPTLHQANLPRAAPAPAPKPKPRPAPKRTSPGAVLARPLTPASAAAFGRSGFGQGDANQLAPLAIDGNPATAWHTDWYTTARFGNLYAGTGLLIDMGRPVTIASAQVTLGAARGATFEVRVGTGPALPALVPVASAADAAGTVRLQLSRPARGRYVLLWFTSLPPNPAGTFEAYVYDVRLRGQP